MGRKISVIIPTHYRNDLLPTAIESVARQDYEPVELISDDSAKRTSNRRFQSTTRYRQADIKTSNEWWQAAFTLESNSRPASTSSFWTMTTTSTRR